MGVDYLPNQVDPRMANKRKMKQELRQEINRLRLEAPKTAKEMENFVFKENEWDKPLDFKPEDYIKYYPGSSKGPEPGDDP